MANQEELPAILNRLAGTTQLDAAGAANAWAGTTGLELLGALNAKAGTTGVGLGKTCNTLAGTTGLDGAGALALVVPPPPPAPTVPGLPTITSFTGGGNLLTTGNLHLTWTAPSDDGGSALLHYDVGFTLTQGGTDPSPDDVGLVTTVSYTNLLAFPFLLGAGLFWAHVRAVNTVGAGAWQTSDSSIHVTAV